MSDLWAVSSWKSMVGGPLSDVRMILCVMVGVRMRSKRRRRKAKQTEVVEGDRRVRENQNLAVSCTDFVHAWSPPWNWANTLLHH